jgi:hypothetical protein
MEGGVVEDIAEDRPQELRLRMALARNCANFSAGVAVLEDRQYFGSTLGGRFAIILRRQVEHLDRPPSLRKMPQRVF